MDDTTLIIIMGATYACIEAIQLIYMAYQQKRTADLISSLLHDKTTAGAILKNGFVGMAEALQADEEAQKSFFSLIKACGDVAYTSTIQVINDKQKEVTDNIKKTISKEIPVPKKYRWIYEAIKETGLIGDKGDSPGLAASSPGKSLSDL